MKKRKRIAAVLILSYCISINSPVFALQDYSEGIITQTTSYETSHYRLYGETRYETAKIISEYYIQRLNELNSLDKNSQRSSENSPGNNTDDPSKAGLQKISNVVIATGNGYADALSSSVLAHELKAPIILVDSKVEKSQDALTYVTENLDPQGTIYIMGGEGVISNEFERKFYDLGFAKVVRVAGGDRYATSYKIASALQESTFSAVVISSGEQYADALSISSIAANQGWPILLAPSMGLTQELKDFLLEKGPEEIYIIGGTGAISDQALTEIRQLLPQVSLERLTGQSRFDTNIVIAQIFAPKPSTIYITTGQNYADALAGSVVAAQRGEPIIYIDPSIPALPKATARYLENFALSDTKPNLVAFGGSGAVSEEHLRNAAELISGAVKATNLHSIPDIQATVVKGQVYSLPKTVRGRLYNSDWVDLAVRWNSSTIDTQTLGLKDLQGYVEGYDKPVKLNLTVNEPLPLGEYSTYFNINEVNRSENLRLAAQAIDGKYLAPGEVFSFNDTVGERTIEAGYREAMVIEGKKFVPGVGGGVCQVSSTLYNAANHAKLEMVERHHHSLSVGYVPPGQDATVYYSVLDFRFKNNTKQNILIRAFIEKGTLIVKIY